MPSTVASSSVTSPPPSSAAPDTATELPTFTTVPAPGPVDPAAFNQQLLEDFKDVKAVHSTWDVQIGDTTQSSFVITNYENGTMTSVLCNSYSTTGATGLTITSQLTVVDGVGYLASENWLQPLDIWGKKVLLDPNSAHPGIAAVAKRVDAGRPRIGPAQFAAAAVSVELIGLEDFTSPDDPEPYATAVHYAMVVDPVALAATGTWTPAEGDTADTLSVDLWLDAAGHPFQIVYGDHWGDRTGGVYGVVKLESENVPVKAPSASALVTSVQAPDSTVEISADLPQIESLTYPDN